MIAQTFSTPFYCIMQAIEDFIKVNQGDALTSQSVRSRLVGPWVLE